MVLPVFQFALSIGGLLARRSALGRRVLRDQHTCSGAAARRNVNSIPQLLLYDIHQRHAGAETLELFDKKPHGLFHPVRGVIGAMRRQQHVLQLVERMTIRQWLLVDDI